MKRFSLFVAFLMLALLQPLPAFAHFGLNPVADTLIFMGLPAAMVGALIYLAYRPEKE